MHKKLNGYHTDFILSLKSGSENQSLSVYTRIVSNRKLYSKIAAIPDYSHIDSIEIVFDGFDCIDINHQNQESLTGNIFLKIMRNQVEEKVLIASPVISLTKSKIGFGTSQKSNNADLNELRHVLFQEWSDSFAAAYDGILVNKFTDHVEPLNRPKKSDSFSAIKGFNHFLPKNKFINGLLISILVLIVGFLGMAVYSKAVQLNAQKNAVKSLDAEALAKQQDDQLNEAFLELGIDRSKLSSDLSCFVE